MGSVPRSLALQVKIGSALVAVVAGLIAALTYVPLALWPSGRRAADIQHSYVEAVRGLSELRGCGFAIRNGALLAYQARWDASIDGAEQERQIELARERCRDALSRFPDTRANVDASAAWRHFTENDVPAYDAAVDAVVAASRAPDPDPAAVRRLLQVAADGDAMLEGLISVQAAKAKSEAERIYAGLRRLSIGYLVIAALGAVGAIVLIVECLRLLRSYARASEQRLSELEAFAGQVAHDLRSPLQTVQLSVGWIASHTTDQQNLRHAGLALRSLTRLHRLIADLLEFARSGSAASARHVTDVSTVVRESCEELAVTAHRAGARLTTTIAQPAYAWVAPVAIKTVVTNLVENALKHGGPAQDNTVQVSAMSRGNEVQLVVEDRGIGIPGDVLPHVFEPFFRASDRPDSYGLGLATVKRLVDAHKGTITVDSEEGRGTRFIVRLPLARDAPPSA